MTIFIDPQPKDSKLPEYDDTKACQDHPKAEIDSQYGFAGGGGLGPYTFCSDCGKILTKSYDPEEPEE